MMIGTRRSVKDGFAELISSDTQGGERRCSQLVGCSYAWDCIVVIVHGLQKMDDWRHIRT